MISFHSLEDRIVKRAFLAAAGRWVPCSHNVPNEQLIVLRTLEHR